MTHGRTRPRQRPTSNLNMTRMSNSSVLMLLMLLLLLMLEVTRFPSIMHNELVRRAPHELAHSSECHIRREHLFVTQDLVHLIRAWMTMTVCMCMCMGMGMCVGSVWVSRTRPRIRIGVGTGTGTGTVGEVGREPGRGRTRGRRGRRTRACSRMRSMRMTIRRMWVARLMPMCIPVRVVIVGRRARCRCP